MDCPCYCSGKGKAGRRYPDPQPRSLCHRLPWSTRGSAAWPGTAGVGRGGGGSFQLHLCLGKFPFMWLPVISPGGSAKGGCPAGSRGRCCSWGHPHSRTRQTAAPPETWEKGGSKRVWGTLASRGHWARGFCWQHTGCRWPRAALWHTSRCGVGGSSGLMGGDCDSADLVPPRSTETPKVQRPSCPVSAS